MTNPFVDKERSTFLTTKVASSVQLSLLPAWPRDHKELPVVELDVDWVRFSTLNHRTKAEQIREIQQSGNQTLFSANPLGKAAQEAQYKILKQQEGFEDLKTDLAERGQQEYAVVTAEGVLINGNRRAAAIRSLLHDDHNVGAKYIKSIVLPADASNDEILALETELQIAKDFKEQYSWVNEGLLIEELYEKHNHDFAMVARLMHRDAKHVKDTYEKVQQLNQLVSLSDGAYLHVDFIENESAFNELAQAVKNREDGAKQGIRATYFLGTLAGVNYRDLRHLRRDDAAELIEQEFKATPELKSILETIVQPGQAKNDADTLIDGVLGQSEPVSLVQKTLDFFATHGAKEEIKLKDGKELSAKEAYDLVGRAIEKASQEAAEQKKDKEASRAPLKRLQAACADVQRAIDTLPKAKVLGDWDQKAYDKALAELKSLIAGLEKKN